MRCTVLAPGMRGDVQPLLVLASGLRRAGVDVRFATHDDFQAEVSELGLEFFHLDGKSSNFFSGMAGTAFREQFRTADAFISFVDRYLRFFLRKLLVDSWNACQDADFVIGWPWLRSLPSLAERLRVPVLAACGCPVLYFPTFRYLNPFQGPRDVRYGPLYNRWSWRWALATTKMGQGEIDHFRENTLKLPPQSWRAEMRALRRLPHLFGWSPLVLPKPFDWPSSTNVTGWWLPEGGAWQPPPELEAFLAAGPAPIGVGFSSQQSKEGANITAMFAEALELTGRRAILSQGLGKGLRAVANNDRMFVIPSVPYPWLMSRVDAMVHHGGAGSTGDTVRAGLPGFAIPFGYDQSLFARRIADLGVAAPPLLPEKLTVRKLADSIRRVTDDGKMRRRAKTLGERVRAEDGVGNALRIIERVVGGLSAG
jgi:UDP:flavonoid glycosyltransferase YjiC (YdhE family)